MLRQLNINARVYSTDKTYLGKLVYLLISQENGRLTSLVIKKGFFQEEEKVVELKSVDTVTTDGAIVKLKISRREYQDLPLLTIYEEEKAYPNLANQRPTPGKLHTRLVTYLPDSAFSQDETTEINEDQRITGQFMQRIKIYTDRFVLLGGKAIFGLADRTKNGILSKVRFNLTSGQIESINLRRGLSFIPLAEFQVPFKLNSLVRLDRWSSNLQSIY